MERRGCDWRFHLSSNDACSRQSDLPWLRCANLGLKKWKKAEGNLEIPTAGAWWCRSAVGGARSTLPIFHPTRRVKSGPGARQTGTRQPYNGGVGSAGRALRSDPRSPEVNSSLKAAQDNVHPTREQCWREMRGRYAGISLARAAEEAATSRVWRARRRPTQLQLCKLALAASC
jgi:hypothetical protein